MHSPRPHPPFTLIMGKISHHFELDISGSETWKSTKKGQGWWSCFISLSLFCFLTSKPSPPALALNIGTGNKTPICNWNEGRCWSSSASGLRLRKGRGVHFPDFVFSESSAPPEGSEANQGFQNFHGPNVFISLRTYLVAIGPSMMALTPRASMSSG